METEISKDFKKQFKSSFIKSIKLGFSIDEIKKQLEQQSYPRDLIDNLISEFGYEEDIVDLLKKKKGPGLMQIIKNKFFRLSEEGKIRKIVKIHSLYYNLIIEEKRKLNEKNSELIKAYENPENKKLVNYFVKAQQEYNSQIKKRISRILKIAKSLKDVELKEEMKDEINKILEHIQTKELDLDRESGELKDIKSMINSPEEIKSKIREQKERMRRQENELQKVIEEISEKSPKFKEAISEV